uniref:DBP10 C-terminal domain-containing protein n=1 Tax=Euplotes harpa TaxID=151035 RepID=A0A7S3J4G9_9SPIT|mmetsp:Transcript_1944/g.2449  ORF Transcript_1944/g.2449 Transcript_1944/m.2449 type:complete len:323 (+) Transcript_1944:336-1304(+)
MYTKNKQTEDLERMQKIISSQNKQISMKEDMKKVREHAQYEIEIQHSNCADAPKAAKARVRKAEEVKAAEKKVVISKHDRKMLKKLNKEERDKFLCDLKSKQTVKRQKIGEEGFAVSEHYIKYEKDERAESMWKKDEKFNMEDLNLNLIPDDEKSLLKKKTEMRWDKSKKKYVQVATGKDSFVKKARNEAGKLINYKRDKDPELYKKWMKKTHLKIQDTGEQEDKHTVTGASSYTKDRYQLKSMGKKNVNVRLKEKEQLRKVAQIEKIKQKKQKLKEFKKGRKRDDNSASSIKFHKKIQAKIERRSRPTKSKIILKERKKKY